MHFLMDFLKVKCKGLFAFVSSEPGTGLGTEEVVSNCLLHCLEYTGHGGSSGRRCSAMTMLSFRSTHPFSADFLRVPTTHCTTKPQSNKAVGVDAVEVQTH